MARRLPELTDPATPGAGGLLRRPGWLAGRLLRLALREFQGGKLVIRELLVQVFRLEFLLMPLLLFELQEFLVALGEWTHVLLGLLLLPNQILTPELEHLTLLEVQERRGSHDSLPLIARGPGGGFLDRRQGRELRPLCVRPVVGAELQNLTLRHTFLESVAQLLLFLLGKLLVLDHLLHLL